MQAVQTLATQSDGNNNNNNNKSQTESNMKAVINDRHGRGLEVHIVGYLERTRQEYVDAVLDQQDACEDDNESYQTICDKLRQTSLTFSKQSSSWALKLAKCDHIVALKASLSKWEKPTTKQTQTQTNSKSRLPKRCGSGRVKPSCEGVIIDI